MENIIKLQKPEEVNIIEWAFQHPNCDALILRNRGDKGIMYVVAYSKNKEGNYEIYKAAHNNEKYGLFTGIDESLLNYMGGME